MSAGVPQRGGVRTMVGSAAFVIRVAVAWVVLGQ